MKFLYVAVMGCMVLITGCVQTIKRNELQDNMKPVVYNSTNNAKNLSLCIADNWDKLDAPFTTFKVQLRPAINGYSVWAEQSIGSSFNTFSIKDSVAYLADIDDTKDGSITRYYATGTYKEEWASALVKCLGDASAKTFTAPVNVTPDNQSSNSTSQKLRELQVLKKDGLITDDEFQNKKKQLLEKL